VEAREGYAAQAEKEDAAPPGHSLIWVSIFFVFCFQKKFKKKER